MGVKVSIEHFKLIHPLSRSKLAARTLLHIFLHPLFQASGVTCYYVCGFAVAPHKLRSANKNPISRPNLVIRFWIIGRISAERGRPTS